MNTPSHLRRCIQCGRPAPKAYRFYTSLRIEEAPAAQAQGVVTVGNPYSTVRQGAEPVCTRCRHAAPHLRWGAALLLLGLALVNLLVFRSFLHTPVSPLLLGLLLVAAILLWLPRDGSSIVCSILRKRFPYDDFLTERQARARKLHRE